LGNVYETACAKRWGFSQPSTAVGQSHVGFTPAVNGGILSSKKIDTNIAGRIKYRQSVLSANGSYTRR
ncbi:hypothetical protein SCJ90_20225, partial [Haloferax volcanii]|uniref:hypothetical protein n=1 Tax=Haloferax volcanii TaxID=2246 RepID=UPI00298DD953